MKSWPKVKLGQVIVSPVQSMYGGYYGLVVVTPPRPCPQTLHRSHDNFTKSLSDCFHILYVDWYRWEDSWEARWAQSDYLWATQAPPPPPRIAQNPNFSHWGPYMNKRPVGLIAPPFIISFLATGNWPKIKLDDCVLSNTKLYHRNLLLWISTKFWIAKKKLSSKLRAI